MYYSDTKRQHRSITTTDKSKSTGSKKFFDPQLQSFSLKTTYGFKQMRNKQQGDQNQRLTVDQIVSKILFIVNKLYPSNGEKFQINCTQFLTKGWDSCEMKITERINTYEYLEMAYRHKSFTEIQAEILKEWKKNYLLFQLLNFWFSNTKQTQFKSTSEFKSYYNVFREFISCVTDLIFDRWYSTLQKKQHLYSVFDKIWYQTSHFIIADSSEFKNIYKQVLEPLIKKQLKHKKINWLFDLTSTIQQKPCISPQIVQDSLSETKILMKKFAKQIKLSKKIKLIKQIRVSVEKQIFQNQKLLIQNKLQKKIETLQGGDFISAYIYCIISGQIQGVQESIIYLEVLLGQGKQLQLQLLSRMQVQAFLMAIKSAVDILVLDSSSSLITHHHFADNINKTESTKYIIQDSSIKYIPDEPIYRSFNQIKTTRRLTYDEAE